MDSGFWQKFISNLTVTLRDYPTPYHTSWQKIAKHTEIVHMRHRISNLLFYVVS